MKKLLSLWRPADVAVGILAGFISLVVYVWSAAPSVTLLDSGEFMVAAQNFGVPHPTGYPLWTILSWLFQLLPLGNAAWEINVFSGVCGALSVGLCAALLCNILRWCFVREVTGMLAWIPALVALSFSLMLAFSESMWSQATIAEVYTLHALVVVLVLICCYMWVRIPSCDGLLMGAFFFLALGFSNHHLILTLALGGVPYLLILLLRRRMFLDWLFAGLLTVLLAFLGFAILSKDLALLRTGLRFTYCTVLALGIFVWLRRCRVRWRFVAYLPFVILVGLLPYAYMPLASATNPPMNWGYTRESEGFFYSINRSQYSGSLSDLVQKSLGRLVGTYQKPEASAQEAVDPFRPKVSTLDQARLWIGFFWMQLVRAFTPLAIIGYFASFFFVFRMTLEKRVWIYLLHLAFVLAAFVQPMTMDPQIDRSGWWLQMPFHTYTNLLFALLSGLGIGLIIFRLCECRMVFFWVTPALLVLPVFTFSGSRDVSSQRGRWFGWMYGYDMLKDLPPGSIMIGGTDPGRFVPTYMILGESLQPPAVKTDPKFDRRDLYIITQNALGEPNYMKYLRDHYTDQRPPVRNAFERWLGRDTTYPAERLVLPNEGEVLTALRQAVSDDAVTIENSRSAERGTILFSTALKLLWEKNRDKHDIYIKESFPLEWTYDYATPHGLIYRLNKEKVAITPEDVARDFAYWKTYKHRLLSDPEFSKDYDAQRSFSKLRQSLANIYRYRKMDKEAEAAYREAIELWPGNIESIMALSRFLWDRGDYETPIKLFDAALALDPNSFETMRLRAIAELRQTAEVEIRKLAAKLAAQPRSGDLLRQLIKLHDDIGETNRVQPLVDRAMKDFSGDADMMRFLIGHYEQLAALDQSVEAARRLSELESSNVTNYLLLARGCFAKKDKPGFYDAVPRAIEIGGPDIREGFRTEPRFAPWRDDPEFQKLLQPAPLLPATQPPLS